MSQIARHVRLSGRVQGVFFRAWTREQANELGVTGWVRNCADGTVEAHLAGEEQDVALLIDRMRRGPPSARVERVEIEDAEPEGVDGFAVRH